MQPLRRSIMLCDHYLYHIVSNMDVYLKIFPERGSSSHSTWPSKWESLIVSLKNAKLSSIYRYGISCLSLARLSNNCIQWAHGHLHSSLLSNAALRTIPSVGDDAEHLALDPIH